ncbi:hypothetical protein HanRHA438_Chr05g0224041 [Helianthus annuus]|nr:hypothetical protein HanRHA438_Chr05g0224041 [Helianthus annuus]
MTPPTLPANLQQWCRYHMTKKQHNRLIHPPLSISTIQIHCNKSSTPTTSYPLVTL